MINQYILNSEREYTPELAGIKVVNLVPYIIYTPEFIVLSTKFYKDWLLNKSDFLSERLSTLTEIALYFQKKDYSRIILRSSCTKEDMAHRGKYHSEDCEPNVVEIRAVIVRIYEDFEDQKDDDSNIAILIQVYQDPKVRGHLSNERRVDKKRTAWLLEESSDSGSRITPFEVVAPLTVFDHSLSAALNYRGFIKSTQSFCTWLSAQPNRYHLEVLWDGKTFWVVQVDIEDEYTYKGLRPGSEWKPKKDAISSETFGNLESLETVTTTLKEWRKIKCVKTFADCGLPYWPVYILENESVLQDLVEHKFHISLSADLKRLLAVPIVIRTDTIHKDVMLPRTETVSSLQDALSFLEEKTQKFISEGLKIGEFCFLIHQFIVSKAGALSFTKPNTGLIRIDSTWGIVEGLYYHPYDSFEFNMSSHQINKKIRCKSYYIDIDTYGSWYLKEAGINFDWHPSLTDNQVEEISKQTQIISKHLGTAVNVMFFINKAKQYPEILPWFYTNDEISDSGTIHRGNVLSVRNRVVIRSKEDFIKLEQSIDKPTKINLFVMLNIGLSRDKVLIEKIANFAKENDYTVDIKGSMLSHPYYVFHSKGVHIRCIDPFQPEYETKKFYKLVRDKIPALISSNNEKVVVRKVSPEQLLGLLKNKIVEEANELYWAKAHDENIEEMSDVLEVLRGLCKIYGLPFRDLEEIADKKREKRGGFEEGIVLVATKEQSALKLIKEVNELFSNEDKDIEAKAEQRVQLFQKGDIDNLKSLTEVNSIMLPYVNNLASKTNTFRYFLKDEKYNSIKIEYDPQHIILKLEVLTSDLKDPSQLNLFK